MLPDDLEERLVPIEWDGKTVYSVGPRIFEWRVYCMACSAESFHHMTTQEVRALRSIPRCQQCGGVRWIEQAMAVRG